jgi:hypothetical protein
MAMQTDAVTFGLTAEQVAERDRLVADLRTTASTLNAAVIAFNEMLYTHGTRVGTALAAYNNAVAAGHDFITTVVDESIITFESQSESWQDSSAFARANAWIEQWQSTALSDADIEVPSRLVFETENAKLLSDLPKDDSDATC